MNYVLISYPQHTVHFPNAIRNRYNLELTREYMLRCIASKLCVKYGLKTRCVTINICLIRVRKICSVELLERLEWLSCDFSIDMIVWELSIVNL